MDELKNFGLAYAKAILEYLGIAYKEQKTTTNNKIYRIQLGAYRNLDNAKNMLSVVKDAGFKDAIIVSE